MTIQSLPESSRPFARMYGLVNGLRHAYSYAFARPLENSPAMLNWMQYQAELRDAKTIKAIKLVADSWQVTL